MIWYIKLVVYITFPQNSSVQHMWCNPRLKQLSTAACKYCICFFTCRKFILLSSGIPSIPTKSHRIWITLKQSLDVVAAQTSLENFIPGQLIWIFVMCVHLPMRHHMPCILWPLTISHLSLIWLASWMKFYQHLDESANIQLQKI